MNGAIKMGIKKFNKGEVLFTNTQRYNEFLTLEELYKRDGQGKQYIVLGVYDYVSSYGRGAFAKSDGFNISLPSHMVDTVIDIKNDSESVEQINNLQVFVEIYTYELEKYPGKTLYSINFDVKE